MTNDAADAADNHTFGFLAPSQREGEGATVPEIAREIAPDKPAPASTRSRPSSIPPLVCRTSFDPGPDRFKFGLRIVDIESVREKRLTLAERRELAYDTAISDALTAKALAQKKFKAISYSDNQYTEEEPD